MEIILEPHVASALLDHYQGKVDKLKTIVHNCRGWLIGTTTSRTATVTNFVPDTFNRPPSEKTKEFKQYGTSLTEWFGAMKALFPSESNIIGFYAVGDGSPVKQLKSENGTETTSETPYKVWSIEYLVNPYWPKRGMAVFVDITVPSVKSPTLDFSGTIYRYAPGTKEVNSITPAAVRIVPEGAAVNTMAQHIIRAAYGETAADTMVPALELDRILAELPEEDNMTDRIDKIFASLGNAVKNAKKGDKVSQLAAKLQEERVAEGSGVSGDILGDDRTRNALMTKLVVTRMQEVIQVLEQTVVRVNGARNKR